MSRKLDAKAIRKIIELHALGVDEELLADRYAVTRKTIVAIISGRYPPMLEMVQ